MIRLSLPIAFASLLLAIAPAAAQSGGPRPEPDAARPPATAAGAAAGAAAPTSGTVVNILVYETPADVFYFRLDQMPKGIDWFKSSSNRSFDLVQQAADKEWTLSVWNNEKGEATIIKAKVTKESATQTPTPPARPK